jgi:hypothetical protein
MSASKDPVLLDMRDKVMGGIPQSALAEADFESQMYGAFALRGALVMVGRAKGAAMKPRTPVPNEQRIGDVICVVQDTFRTCIRTTPTLAVAVTGIGPGGATLLPAEEVAGWVEEVWAEQR